MRYRRVGESGLRVSELSLGGWSVAQNKLDRQELSRLLSEALERGVNSIDLADIYAQGEVESLCGELLRDYPRHQLVLTSKCYWPMSQGVNDRGLSRKHIHESVAGSLKRLQTDYLDLYYCHRFDAETPLEETVRAIGDLISRGQILYWGVCGWSSKQLKQTIELCRALNVPSPISHQLLYNVLERGAERELLPNTQASGLGVSVWSPLAGGCLARVGGATQDAEGGQSQRKATANGSDRWDSNWSMLRDSDTIQGDSALESFGVLAERVNVTPAQLALSWVLRRVEVSTVVMGVSSLEQLSQNISTIDQAIPEQMWRAIDERFPL